MTTTTQRFNVHNFSIEEIQAIDKTLQILTDLQSAYDDKDVLANANDGEIICIEELARVKGILSFVYYNRVVEVNPK
jgi:hypothetical protein